MDGIMNGFYTWQMRTIDLLDNGLARHPERLCVLDATPYGLSDPVKSFTHEEVRQLSHRIANGLHHSGLRRGSRVAIYSTNCALALVCMVGLLRAGAVWLPVNTRNPLNENLQFLKENDCEFVFCHADLLDDLTAIRTAVPTIKDAILVGPDRAAFGLPLLIDWVKDFSSTFPDDEHGPDDLAWIKGTGGTTGRSKSVMICHRNVEALFATVQICFPNLEPLVNLVAAPITHGAGNHALSLMSMGGTNVVIARPDPSAVLDAIEVHRVSTLLLPPTIIYNILATPGVRDRDYSSLRYFLVGAAPISPDRLAEAIDVFGPVMAQVWGQTEAPMICSYMHPADYSLASNSATLKSCGRPSPLTRIEVMDDAGNLLPSNAVGELVIRSNLVMRGYLNLPDETAAVSRFGWHHTGDVGYRDDAGYFYIIDRKKDMIISGGFNIYPSEIEQVLWKHASVLDCAVIGVPDPKWGESVKAVVELKQGSSATEEDLRDHCRSQLGGMKTPKSVEIWATLPRSAVGKVLKREIRERFWSGQERRV